MPRRRIRGHFVGRQSDVVQRSQKGILLVGQSLSEPFVEGFRQPRSRFGHQVDAGHCWMRIGEAVSAIAFQARSVIDGFNERVPTLAPEFIETKSRAFSRVDPLLGTSDACEGNPGNAMAE